jgi:hypothetical protein
MSFVNPRRAIADYLHGIAAWRRQKAEEYDRDARNLRSAAGIEELADYIVALPDDDPRLRRLAELAMVGEFFQPGQMTHYEIGRFRFFHEEATLDAFLTQLVELAEKDGAEHGRFSGRTAPGDDPWDREDDDEWEYRGLRDEG